MTATPHSGKPAEFGSLLGLLDPKFENLNVATADQKLRKQLAAHFVQRRRKDVEKYLDEDTPFPKRDPGEFNYDLSEDYAIFFDRILEFARSLVKAEAESGKKIHYWTALGLLRGVMSSPATGIAMLRKRRLKLDDSDETESEAQADDLYDSGDGHNNDVSPGELIASVDWTESQKNKLRAFETELSGLMGPGKDHKLEATRMVIEDWLSQDFQPVIFCRFIATGRIRRRTAGEAAARDL